MQIVRGNYKVITEIKRKILLLIVLALGLSCNSSKQESKAGLTVGAFEKSTVKKNIRFDFTADRKGTFDYTEENTKAFKERVEIKASLFNDNVDTVYFLSSSCFGEQYSLRYDIAKFTLTPFINCNASYRILLKIAPKGQYDFQAYVICSSKEAKIKLGFDFYCVAESVDVSTITLENIHGRKEQEQTIIWAEEKTIK